MFAGLETGTIQHVPSTQDLLAAQGLDPATIRRSMSQLARSFNLDDAEGLKSSGSTANLLSQFSVNQEDVDSDNESDALHED